MSFWNSENGKIISHGIHDHNSGLRYLRTYISILKIKIEKGENIKLEDIEKLEKGLKRCRDSMDYIYIKFKEKYETSTN